MTETSHRSDSIRALVERRDLTDPCQGENPMQALVDRLDVGDAGLVRRTLRTPPLVPAEDGWQPRHTTTETVLAALPDVLRDGTSSAVLRCAGLVCGGRQTGSSVLVGHQMDYWLFGQTGSQVLGDLVQRSMKAAIGKTPYRLLPADDALLGHGFRLDIADEGHWVEVGRCGSLTYRHEVVAVGFRVMLEPLLAASDLETADYAGGSTATVTSSRS